MNSDDKLSKLKENWTAMEIENYSSSLKKKGVPVIFDVEHFRRLLGLRSEDFYSILFKLEYHYHKLEIPKKIVGTYRQLLLPSIKLKYIQRWILDNILYTQSCITEVTGFIPGKSIVNNARPHLKQKYILKLDIEDFFPSIDEKRVFNLFKNFGYTNRLARTLSRFCSYENELPQGAPSSPYIANLICRKLDARLTALCAKYALNYTRYADDITISGGRMVFKLKKHIINIISDENFSINKSKIKLLTAGDRKKITGIIVNEKLSVPKKVVRELRQEIYYIKKFNLESHMKKTGNVSKSNYKGHLFGIAKYIFMIDKDLGTYYLDKLNGIDWE
ncbi:retron St85 family RNA-directed DNA polymerase [Paenilisteria newyorkensis]|uniref:retron St85 family RNA-directed DNA polymerase n=1 Tax=Listeria newyorkensis TaxID=1497681 RepID=UPI000669E98E|nr:retron St85 family RNA-directed DNA polymerase [Listeria newyorkensis]KMT59096.1 RNA-directed DNA polymerase retron ec67 [Listeria newyorkensis]